MYEIKKATPELLTPKRRVKRNPLSLPFLDLEPGEYFAVPLSGYEKQWSNLRTHANKTGERHGRVFSVYKAYENEKHIGFNVIRKK